MRTAITTTFIIALLASCGTSTSNESNTETAQVKETVKPSEPKSNWEYGEQVDEMDGTTLYYAAVTSDNKVDFEFPYSGGSRMQFVVRNMDNKNGVILTITNGQFMTSILNDEHVRIKFDDNEPEKYNFSSADDGTADIIFLIDSKDVVNKVKSATKVMVEAPFFNEGRQVFHFNLAGLEWEH